MRVTERFVGAGAMAALLAMIAACESRSPAADPSVPESSVSPEPVIEVEARKDEPVSANPPKRVEEPVVAAPAPSPNAVAASFIKAANGDDAAAAGALSTPDCGECPGFIAQAGRKFQAVIAGEVRAAGKRAALAVDVMCGARRCDEVHLLLENGPNGWRVADITESDERVAAWLAPP